MVQEPQEMASVPQETAMVYEEAVHEAKAQNTNDIMPENTEILENDMDNRYVPRSNQYNLCPSRKSTYNNLSLNTVLHESGENCYTICWHNTLWRKE